MCWSKRHRLIVALLLAALSVTKQSVKAATFHEDVQITPPIFESLVIKQPLDHFSYSNRNAGYVPIRYLINRDACTSSNHIPSAKQGGKSQPCPVLFYCGGEDSIEAFANATGFLWELRFDLDAVLVYVEHRYYGTSLPVKYAAPSHATTAYHPEHRKDFTPASFDTNEQDYAFLSSQQALADFAAIASAIVDENQLGDVVAVGGSYGGMLAAWMRQKYQGLVVAALASSADVLAFEDRSATNPAAPIPSGYWDVVASDYDPKCQIDVKSAFETLLQWAKDSEFEKIQDSIGLCNAPQNTSEAINTVAFLQSAFSDLAQHDYPYPTKFIFDLPANPTTVACQKFNAAGGGVLGLAAAASLIIKPSFAEAKPEACVQADLTEWWAFNPGFIPGAWVYQRCTEILMPVEVSVSNPMFLPCDPINLPGNCWQNGKGLASYCSRIFPQAGPFTVDSLEASRLFASIDHGNLKTFREVGNIVFSNGGRDPWHAAGGINNDTIQSSPNMLVIPIPSGAHHIDLRTPNATVDPPDVSAARKKERNFLKQIVLRQ